MRFSHFAFAATVLVASVAEAKPRRVVILDFDGPRQLADAGRSAVMSVLGDQYNIVATKQWDAARARASGRGPQQYRQASKQAGVDAVIEGWVQQEGRHHVLTIAVRDASTGNEIDTVSLRLKGDAVTSEAARKLAVQLDDLLGWIDADIAADPTPSLPDVRTMRPMLGAHEERRQIEEDDAEDDEEDEAPAQEEEAPVAKPKKEKKEKKEKQVAVADDITKDENDLVTLFGPDSKEAAVVTEGKTVHVPQPTPRFQINAGPYVSSRGMAFTSDPEAKDAPPEYPASSIKGFAAELAVYPFPTQKQDGRIQGLGFTLGLQHSVASTLTARDDTGYGDYTLTHMAWDTGVHYRWPIDILSIDASANFGSVSHALGNDFPQSVAIPDTSYSYLGGGVHVDLQVTEKATVGAGAKYMYLLGAGMVTEQDWYGAGNANGVSFDGDFTIPLPHRMYVKGGIEYRRIKIDFEGSGELSQMWGVWDVTDAAITGSGTLGVEF
jgi:hypothetical protein